jgi:hypothetical protein
MRIFPKADNHEAFERVLAQSLVRYPITPFTYCLMPTIGILSCGPKRTRR